MRSNRARFLTVTAAAALMAATAAGCSSSSSTGGGGSGGGNSSNAPITIGTSLSLTGDFDADGQAFEKGYKLWVSQVNKAGGIAGHQVKLTILNDNSSQTQVVTNYQKLITVNHVDLTFGPFSSLLTAPASATAHRYGYAFVEGAGGAPSVFAQKLDNVFDVSLPVANELDPFTAWIKSLPASQRPKTAAYPMANDPFATPQVQRAASLLTPLGVKNSYEKIFPEEVADYKAPADDVASLKPDMVALGSTDVPTVQSFMTAFEQQHFNPKIFIAAAGPDQGSAFTKAVGTKNANGMMVPDAWYGGSKNPLSQAMVKAYLAQYGGTASGINADVAEAYSVGEVIDQSLVNTKTAGASPATMNSKIISYLHSGVTLQSVQGPVKFNSLGENLSATAFIFQWQNGNFVQVLPASKSGMHGGHRKPTWGRQIYAAIADGILEGGVYALMAVGLTLIFGVLDIINIAQGILVVTGAYLSYVLSVHLHIDLFLGLLVTVPAMFILGLGIYWAFIRPLRGRERTSMSLLACYAVAIIIEGILYWIFGANEETLHASYITNSFRVFGFYLSDIYVYGFILAVALVVGLYLLLYRTRFGRSVRATMQDQTAARLIGIQVNKVAGLTFAIGVAVTAAGGMMFGATSGGFTPNSGYDLISRLLAIIILGGLGSIGGALVASVFMITLESLVDIWSPNWAIVVFYVALVVVLTVRPTGMFGRQPVRAQ